jgi:hypothetical protein
MLALLVHPPPPVVPSVSGWQMKTLGNNPAVNKGHKQASNPSNAHINVNELFYK